jgi:Na+/pantothenate symporter
LLDPYKNSSIILGTSYLSTVFTTFNVTSGTGSPRNIEICQFLSDSTAEVDDVSEPFVIGSIVVGILILGVLYLCKQTTAVIPEKKEISDQKPLIGGQNYEITGISNPSSYISFK